jgi:hypothetical protein
MWLRHTVRGAIESAFSGTWADVDPGRVSVNIPRRSVTVRDLRIKAQNNDLAHRGFTVVSLDVTFDKISLGGVGYKNVDGKPAVKADLLTVESPFVALVTRVIPGDASENSSPPPEPSRRGRLSEKLHSLSVDKISVTGAALDYVRWLSDSESTLLVAGGGNLDATDFTLDGWLGNPEASPEAIIPADMRLAVDSLFFGFGGGAQVLRADTLALETLTGALTLKRLALLPQYPKEQFAGRSKGHTDWTRASVEGIACAGVDFARLFREKTLSIREVSLDGAELESYKNRKVFRAPSVKPMLYQTIQNLPLPFRIATLRYRNLDVTYEELSAGGDSPGTVTLTRGEGSVTNLTNIAEGNDRFMTIDFSSTLMHGGALRATMLFPVSGDDDHWEITGKLGPTDLTSVNRALEPLMNVRITSGRIASLDFHLTGTHQRSHMELTMAYNDLKVEFLDKHDHTRERKFLTFLADDILIRPDNPGRGGDPPRRAQGNYTRDPERSMFNYIWHSFIPAILKTVI